MLKIFVRFLTAVILISAAYLVYVNSKFSSLQQFTDKKIISVKLQNLPEIILPLKEDNVGYQYEFLKSFLSSFGKKEIKFSSLNNDIEIYYEVGKCDKCIVINKQDLLLITNNDERRNNNIEVLDIYKNMKLNKELTNKYKINYTSDNLDEHIYNLSNNLISYAIVTRSSYLFYKKYYPNLDIIRKINSIDLVWRFPNDDGSIIDALLSYLQSDEGIDITERLNNKYYSRDTISSYIFIGSRLFISDMVTKLPKFENIFKRTASKYNIDWKLLAAISYQESKWNNNSISPTGVRGLMMLTESTAKMLNVDRLNISESIDGGARYILELKNKFTKYQKETRLNLALASYNVGPGHIQDVIILANKDNVDINEWENLKKYILKLNIKEFYKKMRYGYARGWEAAQYVENIKQYYDILTFLEEKDDKNKNNILYEVPNTL
tara:strand:+ start:510 stop:1820 length:1311 start_codon:yes stop_codon:yes gene_type:complete